MTYIVLVEYNEKSDRPGCRYWTDFETKEDYERTRDRVFSEAETVIREDISPERATALCQNVDLYSLVKACFSDATEPTGNVDPTLLHAKIATVEFALFSKPPSPQD